MTAQKIHSALCTLVVLVVLLAAAVIANCKGPSYRDGVYEGASGPDDTGAWGEISVTVREGKVAACAFITREKDGTVKGEDYGKINGEISNAVYYGKAQLAVRAMERYAKQFAETGSLDQVEAVSGATISHDQFLEAAEGALKKARK
jgi:major membrane immunogen (membrane-anchored lipoprotein)